MTGRTCEIRESFTVLSKLKSMKEGRISKRKRGWRNSRRERRKRRAWEKSRHWCSCPHIPILERQTSRQRTWHQLTAYGSTNNLAVAKHPEKDETPVQVTTQNSLGFCIFVAFIYPMLVVILSPYIIILSIYQSNQATKILDQFRLRSQEYRSSECT